MVTSEYSRVMVAIDGSRTAELALKKAVNIVKRNKGTLIIAHIVDTRSVTLFPQYDGTIHNAQLLERSKSAAQQTVDLYKDWAVGKGLENVETVLRNGSPRTELSDVLPEELNIDLLILGATGLSAIERAFVGSVSQHVIRNAPCDVLVVRTTSDEIDDTPIINRDL